MNGIRGGLRRWACAAAVVAVLAAHGTTCEPGDGYVVAADRATLADGGWKQVVDALAQKHQAAVVGFDGQDGLGGLVAELRRSRPKYVCFVLRPESAGRNFVRAAHAAMRRLDDDPYGDAIWGIVTGCDAKDALGIVNAPPERKIRSVATSMGSPQFLDAWESGVASDERTADNLWVRRPGGANAKVATGGNIAQALAEAFNSVPLDYFVTSGHASERDWQIVYNQNRGRLVHTGDAGLRFLEPGGRAGHDLTNASLRVYIGAGNCLIGHVDSPVCMATAWMRTAGVEQFAGYTVPSWYGFMGWGAKGLFEEGRYSLPEARFLTNERLLWARRHRLPASESRGLDYDRDVFAFYGDPAQRIMFPRDSTPYTVEVEGGRVEVRFTRDCDLACDLVSAADARGLNPVMALLTAPPPGNALFDADGKPVADAVVTERFLLVPAPGHHAAGETLAFTIAGRRSERPAPR